MKLQFHFPVLLRSDCVRLFEPQLINPAVTEESLKNKSSLMKHERVGRSYIPAVKACPLGRRAIQSNVEMRHGSDPLARTAKQ